MPSKCPSPSRASSPPPKPFIPGLNFLPDSPVNRHLAKVSSSVSSSDSPPRKLSAVPSSSGNGGPSPRRRHRPKRTNKNAPSKLADSEKEASTLHCGATPQQQQRQSSVERPGTSIGSISQYLVASPKNPARLNNNVGDEGTDKSILGLSAVEGITPLSGKDGQATPGKKKKKRRRKKTSATTDEAGRATNGELLMSPQRQSQLTEFYQVRRSDRKPKSEKEQEEKERIHEKIKSGSTDGLQIEDIPGKGRGIVAQKNFKRGDFVIEYAGDLISIDKAKEREEAYRENPSVGCYMYYFNFRNRKFCVDATAESGKLGRLINHSTKTPNLNTRLFPIGETPHLIFIAARNINAGEELMYDYGDRSKDATEAHPWLKC